MKHQARLIKRAREKMRATGTEFARALGLRSKQVVSQLENGETSLEPHRWKYINGLVAKDEAMQAYLDDMAIKWEEKYERA